MKTNPARSAIRVGLAALGLVVAVPMFGACAVQTSGGGEEVAATSEALTCGSGTEYGTATCSWTQPNPVCYGNPGLSILAGNDPLGLVSNQEAPVLLYSGSCSYSTPQSDDVSAFISAMRQYTSLSPEPINVYPFGPGTVYLGYDVSGLSASALASVQSLIQQWSCNQTVNPTLYKQLPDFSDCPYSRSRPYLPRDIVLFDPSGCPAGGCKSGGGI
jgi:hypothetical protein